jgi:hypothetical protein
MRVAECSPANPSSAGCSSKSRPSSYLKKQNTRTPSHIRASRTTSLNGQSMATPPSHSVWVRCKERMSRSTRDVLPVISLGSMFNHASFPNVAYVNDYATNSIQFTLSKSVEAGEELCIYYGPDADEQFFGITPEPDIDDGWGGLNSLEMIAWLGKKKEKSKEFVKPDDLPWIKITSEIAPQDMVLKTSTFSLFFLRPHTDKCLIFVSGYLGTRNRSAPRIRRLQVRD